MTNPLNADCTDEAMYLAPEKPIDNNEEMLATQKVKITGCDKWNSEAIDNTPVGEFIH